MSILQYFKKQRECLGHFQSPACMKAFLPLLDLYSAIYFYTRDNHGLYSLYGKPRHKGGGTGGARGAIAPQLFTDHFKKDILFYYSDTENFIDISGTKIGLE